MVWNIEFEFNGKVFDEDSRLYNDNWVSIHSVKTCTQQADMNALYFRHAAGAARDNLICY
jgi:hypothetical protein